MPGNIYYLVASLPHLRYPDPPPLTIDALFSACRAHMSDRYVKKLEAILEGDHAITGPGTSALELWLEWDEAARGELARLRAERLGRSIVPVHDRDGKHAAAVDASRKAFHASSPIDADDTLESARWDYIDSLEFGRYFNLEWLVIYLLKLKVLVRRDSFNVEKGGLGLKAALTGRKEEIGVLMETGR